MKTIGRAACLFVVVTAVSACGEKPPAKTPGSHAAAAAAAAARRAEATKTNGAAPAPAAAQPGTQPTTTATPTPPATNPPTKGGKPAPAPIGADLLADLAKWDAAKKEDRRAAAMEAAKHVAGFELLRLEPFSCGGQTHEVAVFKHVQTEMEFVLVPGGTFDMGSPESEKGREVYENLHAVTLTKPYLIARTEVSQATWNKVMGTDPSKHKGADLPVEMVSWEDAQSFCEKTGLALPTEAQWERACRAGTSARFFHGDDVASLGDYAWYATMDIDPKAIESHPVGKKSPNAFGLFDMLGNVSEWCGDMMSPYPTAAVVDPFTTIDPKHKSPVFRGGSFRRPDVVSRPAFRLSQDADAHDSTIGFRPAKTLSME
jgi:formylglycine-generating enzyme required for sulfatase activity